jgi:hypothetical protein
MTWLLIGMVIRYGFTSGANSFATSVASGFEGLAVSSHSRHCLTELPVLKPDLI